MAAEKKNEQDTNKLASHNCVLANTENPIIGFYPNTAAHNQHLGVLSCVGGIKVLKQSESDHFSDCKQ